jgi:hypothetical protein
MKAFKGRQEFEEKKIKKVKRENTSFSGKPK